MKTSEILPIKRWECSICGSIITSEKKPSNCVCGSKQLKLLSVEGDLPEEELKKILLREQRKERDFELIWEGDMDDYEIEDKGWIIDKIIPAKSVGVWTGKRGTFKTFLVLNAIFAVASGKQFLRKYDTRQGKVIYLDKENGLEVMKQRKNMIKKGLEIDNDVDVGFICFSNLKIDKSKDIIEIEKLIKEHSPSLLVVDTYRRGISFEENDAGKVSWLFVDILRPIVEKFNTSIILIHHDKKGETPDEMDAIRGSSDLANYADFILKNERRGVNLILKQLKLRNAPEINPINIKMETDDINEMTFISTGNYELQTKDGKCAEVLTLWIITKGIESFKTKDAQDIAFKEGIRKQNFFNSLQLLVDSGLIKKEERGSYRVISKDSKLVV